MLLLLNSSSENLLPAQLYLIENDTTADPQFIDELRATTKLNLVRFNNLKDALSADAPYVILADFKTIGDADAITTLTARFTAPLIILSDRPSMASAVTAMRAGACDFFPKPASISAIAERISGLLAQRTMATNQMGNSQNRSSVIMPFWEQERDIIENALDVCNGNISRAAAALQISPSTIHRKKQTWEELTGARNTR